MIQKKPNQRWRSRPSPSLVKKTEHAKQHEHEEHGFRENPYLHLEPLHWAHLYDNTYRQSRTERGPRPIAPINELLGHYLRFALLSRESQFESRNPSSTQLLVFPGIFREICLTQRWDRGMNGHEPNRFP